MRTTSYLIVCFLFYLLYEFVKVLLAWGVL